MTRLPDPASLPNDFTSMTLHSILILLSFTIGGFINVEGSGVKPALMNSFTPLGYSQLASDTWCTMSYVTTFMATSGTSKTFSSVCLVVLLRILRDGEKITIGGWEENRLKKLN